MKRFAALTIALLLGAPAIAGPFTGTSVADLDSQAGLGKDVYLVAHGYYSCESCTPPRHYRADGRMHRIVGDPEVTSESVTIAGPRTIVTRLIEKAMIRSTTMTVAPDNRTATYVSIDHRSGIRQPLKSVYLARRVGSAPAGAHPVSGTWQGVAYESVPELIRTTELRDEARSFTYRVPIGATYTARIGGGPAPLHGLGTEGQQAAVKRIDAHKIVETRTRSGEVIMVRTFTLSPDGKVLTMASQYPQTHSSFTINAHRKSRAFRLSYRRAAVPCSDDAVLPRLRAAPHIRGFRRARARAGAHA